MAALTELALKALKTDSDGLTLLDGHNLKGKVRVKASGAVSVSFAYAYKIEGRFREVSCGTWPRDSLKAIRATAADARALLKQGVDPAERRKAVKLEERAADAAKIAHHQGQLARPTVRKLFEQWANAELRNRKDQGAETKRGLEKDVIPAMGERHADDIKRADVMAVLDRVKDRGANRLANRIAAELRQMFGYALDREIVTANPLASITKAKVGGKDAIRTRVLSEQELRALPAVLADSGLLKSTQHVVWTLLATSARVGELCKAKRADIDLEARIWRIPAENSKNGDEHMIYLSAFAAEHMKALLDLSTSDEWLLPASRGKSHVDPKSVTKQIADRQLKFYNRDAHSKRSADEHALELPGGKWGPHDLRRTSATLAQQCGVLPVVIEAMLNHKEPNRMAAVYQRYDYAVEQHEAWERVGQRLTALTSDNVLTLNSASAA